jgi:prepilin-type N-terminal cleavage/methylation domain-containing protein
MILHRAIPKARASRDGFTLIEICIVLLILGLLVGVLAPGIQSAFAEQALRADASQLSLMVKTAMLRVAEEHRAYALDLTDTSLALEPLGVDTPAPGSNPSERSALAISIPNPGSRPEAAGDAAAGDDDIRQTWKLTDKNQLLLPDPQAAGKWLPLRSAQWIFRPGELCPATTVCFTRGPASLSMNFNALTGNVEDEKSFIP